jgi:hypothetical protein
MPKGKEKNYMQQVGAVAPIFVLKSLIGDMPKGAVEKAVEQKVLGKQSLGKGFTQGLKGRGFGRALGGGTMGILTAPVFLKGVQLAGSKKKSDRMKGIGLIAGSAGVYQGYKGLTEGFFEGKAKGRAAGLAKAKNLMLTRAAYKVPLAVAFGMSVAAGRKKSKKGGEKSKYLIPALAGAGIGALSRGGEAAVGTEVKSILKGTGRDLIAAGNKNRLKAVFQNPAMRSKILKTVAGAGAGGAAGGLLGGLVLAGVVDKAMKAMGGKKK